MASNLDYLDPTLQPLADKVQAYIQAEKEFQRAEVAVVASTHQPPNATSDAAAGQSLAQPHEQLQLKLQGLRDELHQLRQEVIDLLPVRDEWVKINLGYGPSRVGAFSTSTPDAALAAPEYDLRVVV
ncbi:hypothetical protein [Hymenobacter glacieicola]|uniref:Uncharacterized protein n=1 Tax=Hymenobacter glacieicola TaxID=1562124 RepID=A0ABQ1WT84_9BACT|nr:hypothetical protein [Hymenobacter glacieicola]GGG42132.1 hypothetical protein GCM10011378_18100 [Hymenobacter glacieicola]